LFIALFGGSITDNGASAFLALFLPPTARAYSHSFIIFPLFIHKCISFALLFSAAQVF